MVINSNEAVIIDSDIWIKMVVDRLFLANGYFLYFDENFGSVSDVLVKSVMHNLCEEGVFADTFNKSKDFCLVTMDTESNKLAYTLSHCSFMAGTDEFSDMLKNVTEEYAIWSKSH